MEPRLYIRRQNHELSRLSSCSMSCMSSVIILPSGRGAVILRQAYLYVSTCISQKPRPNFMKFSEHANSGCLQLLEIWNLKSVLEILHKSAEI